MSDKYILEGHTPKLMNNLIEWAMWFETADCCVAQTTLPKGVRVSTVFLGLDHSFGGGKPILFETMIFGGKYNDYQERYSTWEEAEVGHKKAVAKAEGKE